MIVLFASFQPATETTPPADISLVRRHFVAENWKSFLPHTAPPPAPRLKTALSWQKYQRGEASL